MMAAPPSPRSCDVIAIGALNIDYPARIDDANRALMRSIHASFPEICRHSETLIDPVRFGSLKAGIGHMIHEHRLGGSAFNALRTARTVAPQLRLGFIGTIGDPEPDPGFSAWFARHAIETPFVTVADRVAPGACLAIEHDGERTLVTTRGANDLTAATLAARADEIAAWIATARIVHISSFLDDMAAGIIADILQSCLKRHPALEISIDPGAHWARRRAIDPSVRRLIDLATILFANGEEFREIWRGAGDSPHQCTDTIRRCQDRPPSARVLVKSPGGLALFEADGTPIHVHRHQPLEAGEITDATGAGDAVTGAYLAAMLDPDLAPATRLEAASAVARASLVHDAQAEPQLHAQFRKGMARLQD